MEKRKFISRAQFAHVENSDIPLVDGYSVEELSFVNEKVTENGRIVNRSVVKTVNRSEALKAFKVTDFCLENQIAVGSDGLNKYITLSGVSLDKVCSKFDSMSAAIDAAKSDSKSE